MCYGGREGDREGLRRGLRGDGLRLRREYVFLTLICK